MNTLPSATHFLRAAADDIKSSSVAVGSGVVPILIAYALLGAVIIGLVIEQSGITRGITGNVGGEPLWLKTLQLIGQLAGVVVHVLVLQVLNGTVYQKKKHPPFNTTLSRAFSLLIPALWVSLLYSITVIGGLIALIVPGVIFSLWYFFSVTALVVDGTWGTASLRASHALVRGRFWPIATRVGILASVGLVLSFLVAVVSIILVSIGTGILDVRIPPLWLLAVGSFVYLFFSALVSIYPTYALLLLYHELKRS